MLTLKVTTHQAVRAHFTAAKPELEVFLGQDGKDQFACVKGDKLNRLQFDQGRLRA